MNRALLFDRDRAEVGRWGSLILLDHHHLELDGVGRETFEAELDFPAHLAPIGWLYEDEGVCLLTWVTAERALVIDLSVPELSGTWEMARDSDRGLRDLKMRSTHDGKVLVLWERGLACVGVHGRPEWLAMHEDGTAGFDEITDDEVWIKGRSGDPARNQRRAYRLSDGHPEAATSDSP